MDLRNFFITTERPYTEGTVEVFQQQVTVRNLQRATLQITALGLYEAEINGRKVGDALFTPGYTYYPRNLHCQTYDVTELLQAESLLTVYLAQGWYCGRFTFDNKTQIYGSRPAAAWVLTIEHADGTSVYRSTPETVQVLASPYEYAGFYDGEIYRADGSSHAIFPPVAYDGPLPEIIEEADMLVRIRETLPVQEVIHRGDVIVLDFGQNFAGIVTIDPLLMKSDTLRLRHGELLNADGSLYTNNLRKAKAEIVYHRGSSRERYRPRFTYMGFRYVELSGADYTDGLLTAYAIHSDMERTGHFTSENPLVDRLYRNQVWGQKSNYVEVPTDCPQRDERMGYTGDGHVFALTGAYNFDTEAFWKKFLKDIRYSQMDNSEGYVAASIPALGKAGIGFMSMLGWGNAVCILPELLYHQYGTEEPLRQQYASMKQFVECEIAKMGGLLGKKDLWLGPSLGDWLTLGRDVKYMAMHNGPVSNAFLVNDLRIMVWAAGLLGHPEDAARYQTQLDKTRSAYLKAFVKPDGSLKDDYQGAYIMALQMVIPRGDLWNNVFAKLIAKIKDEGMQTGFFATEHILPLLADNGQAKLAFDLLLQEECPGWMYQVLRGATTTWERWDALRPDGSVNEIKLSGDNMVSFNHYAFGSVGKFYYQHILGIRPLEPGFRKVQIQPFVDPRLGRVSGSYQSRSGEIKVSYGEGKLEVMSQVEGFVLLPDGSRHELLPGKNQHFKIS